MLIKLNKTDLYQKIKSIQTKTYKNKMINDIKFRANVEKIYNP